MNPWIRESRYYAGAAALMLVWFAGGLVLWLVADDDLALLGACIAGTCAVFGVVAGGLSLVWLVIDHRQRRGYSADSRPS